MTKSFRTSAGGLAILACIIIPVFVPAAAIPCAKIAALASAWIGIHAKDETVEPAADKKPDSKTLLILLFGIFLFSSAPGALAANFFGQRGNFMPSIFLGSGNVCTNQYATNGAVGSVYFDLISTNRASMFVRSSTNVCGWSRVNVFDGIFSTTNNSPYIAVDGRQLNGSWLVDGDFSVSGSMDAGTMAALSFEENGVPLTNKYVLISSLPKSFAGQTEFDLALAGYITNDFSGSFDNLNYTPAFEIESGDGPFTTIVSEVTTTNFVVSLTGTGAGFLKWSAIAHH